MFVLLETNVSVKFACLQILLIYYLAFSYEEYDIIKGIRKEYEGIKV